MLVYRTTDWQNILNRNYKMTSKRNITKEITSNIRFIEGANRVEYLCLLKGNFSRENGKKRLSGVAGV